MYVSRQTPFARTRRLAVDRDMALVIIGTRIERCAGLVKLVQRAKGRQAKASAEIVLTTQDLVTEHDVMSVDGDWFETEILHERLQGIEADFGVVIEFRDPSLVNRRNGVETPGQNLPAESRRCLKKCDVEKPGRKPFEQMGHHQPTRTASDDCQLNHANRLLRKAKARGRAEWAGRTYPNLVDNMRVAAEAKRRNKS